MRGYDVIVMGEILVELHSTEPLHDASTLRLSFSGDVLNAAAAAAAAGARTAVLTAIGDDELGLALTRRLDELGVHTALIRRTSRPNGAYMVASDTTGEREFIYWRTGSAASTLSPDDVRTHCAALESCRAFQVSGIAAALSPSCESAVLAAVRTVRAAGGHVTYDPNFRPRLTDTAAARRVLAAVAPHARLLTPSCPGDSSALLDTTDPDHAATRCAELGATTVAVTAGAGTVIARTPDGSFTVAVPRNPNPVDATGAGDVLAGTTTARLALGDDVRTALRLGVAAASLSVSGRGGTGYLPPLSRTRELAATIGTSSRSTP